MYHVLSLNHAASKQHTLGCFAKDLGLGCLQASRGDSEPHAAEYYGLYQQAFEHARTLCAPLGEVVNRQVAKGILW